MSRGGRARGVIVGSRPLIPAHAVPEDLIAQAQVVLQGKSREAIIRELQRTNLDVNQAVNNLLSREDDDADEYEEDSYIPEELIHLLDAGISDASNIAIIDDGLYPEDVFGYSIRRRMNERGYLSLLNSVHTSGSLVGLKDPCSDLKETFLQGRKDQFFLSQNTTFLEAFSCLFFILIF